MGTLSFGLVCGFSITALPFLLAKNGVPVDRIASVSAVAMSPLFWGFLMNPVVDVDHRIHQESPEKRRHRYRADAGDPVHGNAVLGEQERQRGNTEAAHQSERQSAHSNDKRGRQRS